MARGNRGRGRGRGRGTGRGLGRPPAPAPSPSPGPSQTSRGDSASSPSPVPPTRETSAPALSSAPSNTEINLTEGYVADPVPSVSANPPTPSTSSSDPGHQKFGKLIAPEHKINWAKGVWYNFGYFVKCDEGAYARCLICAKGASLENKTLDPLPDVGPEKQPMGIVEIPGASTSKVQHH